MLDFVGKQGLFWLSGLKSAGYCRSKRKYLAVALMLLCCTSTVNRKGDNCSVKSSTWKAGPSLPVHSDGATCELKECC